MTHAQLKIENIGGSAGIVLPKEVLEELRVAVGDTLYLVRTERGFEITASDPDFEEAMALAREVSLEYRDALRRLSD